MTLPKLEKDYKHKWPIVVGISSSLFIDLKSRREKWNLHKKYLSEFNWLIEGLRPIEVQCERK